MKSAFIMVIFFFISNVFCSVLLNPKFEHISVKDGLSSVNVLSIYQDHFGFLWIGTEFGLNKYDGYNLVTYVRSVRDTASLSHNAITCISEDNDNNLWVGTGFNGINKFNRDQDNFLNLCPKSLYTTAFYKDHVGDFWIGAEKKDGGLAKLIKVTDSIRNVNYSFEYFPLTNGNQKLSVNENVNCIYEDSHLNFWIGTNNGICRINNSDSSITRFLNSDTARFSNKFLKITCILEDNHKNIWIGTKNSGIYTFDYNSNKFQKAIKEIVCSACC